MAGLRSPGKPARKRKAAKDSPLDDASDAIYRFERGVSTRPKNFGATADDRAYSRYISSAFGRGK